MNQALLIAVCSGIIAHTAVAPAEVATRDIARSTPPQASAHPLPLGRWHIEFANGVVETCEIRNDGTATVAEPQRTSSGRAARHDGALVLTFDDDRVERWTPVGRRMVVEHWYPATGFPQAAPVLGIAQRALRQNGARFKWKGRLSAVPIDARTAATDRSPASHPEAIQADARRLAAAYRAMQANPDDEHARQQALALARTLAPLQGPAYPVAWKVLLHCGVLKDGLTLDESRELLECPTSRTDAYVEWYFNPGNRRAAPFLRAKITENGLADWTLDRR